MTPEQRIAQLEADLARERARADGLQEIIHNLTAKRRSAGAERQAAYRERKKTECVTSDVTVTRNSDASPSPSPSSSPPLPFSLPPPSKPSPSILYPFSPASPPPPPEKPRAREPSVDLHSALSAVHLKHDGREMPWSMGLERIHTRLLALASRDGFTGDAAVPEIAKRYDHMRQRAGLQYEKAKWKGATLEELGNPECWGGNAKPPTTGKHPAGPGIDKSKYTEGEVSL